MASKRVRIRPVTMLDEVKIVLSFASHLDRELDSELAEYHGIVGNYANAGVVILDFSETTTIDADAIRILSELRAAVRSQGLQIRACEWPKTIDLGQSKSALFNPSEVYPSFDQAMFPLTP